MKKVTLSALAAVMLSGVAYADTMSLYSDPKTGQVFTTPAEGRVAMGDFVDAKTIDANQREGESAFSEYKDAQKKYVNVKSKAKTLEFSGTSYFGLTSADPKTIVNPANNTVGDQSKYLGTSTGFELRRAYLQLKAYINDKDYFRFTLDTTKELASTTASGAAGTTTSSGYANTFFKYAYLYLDEVLPYTGVEVGIAHRPWIDYEEHNSWYHRSFNKVALEEKGTATEAGVDLVNSADLGVNFKTKTEMFSSEIGIFNGEGYHADKEAANQENSSALSAEWRLTGHLIGSGTKVGKNDLTKDTYLHVSTMGLISNNHKDDKLALNQAGTARDKSEYDRTFYGLHAVYNQPAFLIAAQYVTANDKARNQDMQANLAVANTSWVESDYDLWSINGEVRPFTDWTIIGRYDNYKIDDIAKNGTAMNTSVEGEKYIAAIMYKMNKNVNFIGSAKFIDEKYTVAKAAAVGASGYNAGMDTGESKNVYMLTTEVKF
ncbi:MAG: hypothetical protein Q7T77_10890 [Sulfuricurvum sp.]|nr:hypothetical protein [Sulfuricurvum sp.]